MSCPARRVSPMCRHRLSLDPAALTRAAIERMQEISLPQEISLEGNAIVITWDDGHRSPYSHRFLRLRCPCASCVEEMTGRPILDPDSVPADVKAIDHMPVGNYGMQFLWDDTHYTGIYTYRLLRAACTCIICNQARAEAAAEGS